MHAGNIVLLLLLVTLIEERAPLSTTTTTSHCCWQWCYTVQFQVWFCQPLKIAVSAAGELLLTDKNNSSATTRSELKQRKQAY
jgi:hypothetical protein